MLLQHKTSQFIQILAWIFIIFASIGLIMSIAQTVFFQSVFPFSYMESTVNYGNEGVMAFLTSIQLILWLFAVITLLELISAIGLLKRQEWARKMLMIVLGVAIVYQLGLLVIQWKAMSSLLEGWGMESTSLSGLMNLIKFCCATISIGLSVLFGWFIVKLRSREVKREFVQKS